LDGFLINDLDIGNQDDTRRTTAKSQTALISQNNRNINLRRSLANAWNSAIVVEFKARSRDRLNQQLDILDLRRKCLEVRGCDRFLAVQPDRHIDAAIDTATDGRIWQNASTKPIGVEMSHVLCRTSLFHLIATSFRPEIIGQGVALRLGSGGGKLGLSRSSYNWDHLDRTNFVEQPS
jgi:hypothetical protein